jgi:hypothetical protein
MTNPERKNSAQDHFFQRDLNEPASGFNLLRGSRFAQSTLLIYKWSSLKSNAEGS